MAVATGVVGVGEAVAVGVTGVAVAVGVVGLAVAEGLEVADGVGVDVTMLGGAVGGSACPGICVGPPGGGSSLEMLLGSSANAVDATKDMATALPTIPQRMRIRFFIKDLLLIRRRPVNRDQPPPGFHAVSTLVELAESRVFPDLLANCPIAAVPSRTG